MWEPQTSKFTVLKIIVYLKRGDAMNETNTTSVSGFTSNQRV
jgi:hypothetical protein